MAHEVIVPKKKNYVPKFLKQRDIGNFKKVEAPPKCPEKWLMKLLSQKKKIMSQSFLNSRTLVILCLFATMGPQLCPAVS
jgi:hypothetical protein